MRRAALLLLFMLPAQAATYYVTVAGLGGDPDYEKRFVGWAQEIDKALRAPDAAPPITTLYGPSATRARVRSTLELIARDAKPQDSLVLLLIGHGTFDGLEYKMNVPGPDITAGDLAQWLNHISAGRQLVVNMTSASGASLPLLEQANRIVVTATKSGTETNATVFPRYFVDALKDEAADTDKNRVISALEAFRYAEEKTAKFYETEKRLATEHPELEDTGKGEGVRDPSANNGKGLLAASFPLVHLDAAAAAVAPAKAALLQRKQELEAEIDRLKYRKAAMAEDEYTKQLTALLIELAKTQREIDR